MLFNRIVARYADGRVLKGTSQDFAPEKDVFHVIQSEGGSRPIRVAIAELKAVFFVKDLIGNPSYQERKEFSGPVTGRKVRVTFADSEVIVGSTESYGANRPGFFLVPADPQSNNDRVYVVSASVRDVQFLP